MTKSRTRYYFRVVLTERAVEALTLALNAFYNKETEEIVEEALLEWNERHLKSGTSIESTKAGSGPGLSG